MSPEYRTKALAEVYESQGHLQDALDIYRELDRESNGGGDGLQEACRRLEAALATSATETPAGTAHRTAHLLEQWLKLLTLEKRLEQFKKIRARLQ